MPPPLRFALALFVPIPLAFALSACQASVSTYSVKGSDAEAEITDGVKEQTGVSVEASCPEEMNAASGKTYTCELTLPNGRTDSATITMTNGQGGYKYKTEN